MAKVRDLSSWQSHHKWKPRNEAGARQAKERMINSSKGECSLGMRWCSGSDESARCGRGQASNTGTFHPWGLIRHYGCLKDYTASLAEGQGVTCWVNHSMNNSSLNLIVGSPMTKLPLASYNMVPTANQQNPTVPTNWNCGLNIQPQRPCGGQSEDTPEWVLLLQKGPWPWWNRLVKNGEVLHL
jgi:hypothetical protein